MIDNIVLLIKLGRLSYTYHALYVRVRVVTINMEIFVMKPENVIDVGIDAHCRQPSRLARKLESHLLEVVVVDMGITERVDKLAGFQLCHLRHHQEEKGVGSDVEWHPKEDVGRALIQLQTEPAVSNIELEQGVAWRQVHIWDVGYVPRAYDYAAGVGIVADVVDGL